MSDLDLVEDYPREFEMTQFEKVLLAARRAKDLHVGRAAQLVPSTHKHPYMALEEIKEQAIALEYREEALPEALPDEADDADEDE
ncbi:MAG: DNA-directed RNA polymerase subunit omega [Candidatus Lambdaproteobacteria bacterium]|nr:DNA-directed RNA polymerase subunit omega [Candidatus Lambdaproteobacteria bacterium]